MSLSYTIGGMMVFPGNRVGGLLTAVDLINQGSVRIAELITDRIHLDDVVTLGFQTLIEDPGAHLKVAVLPSSSE